MDLGKALECALAAAQAGADALRRDFYRPGGPRGSVDKAEADLEAEHLIRDLLRGAFPDWGYLGEETGRQAGKAGTPVWLVDPNDGTRDYLRGWRGSAVSIGLVAGGRPVLGVVFAFAYPDGKGDLFAWAEGCGPLRRNGQAVSSSLPSRLEPPHVVLVSSHGDDDPEANLRCTAPARFRSVPSVAHRLALLAAGEAAAAISLFAPGAWDYAAGHALVRATGGVLLNESASEVMYDEGGASRSERAFAGALGVAQELARRSWERGVHRDARSGYPARLRRGEAVAEVGPVARAQGCLLGLVGGGNLGGGLAYVPGDKRAAPYGDGPPCLGDADEGQTLAGQPRRDSELALALGRAILARGAYDADRAFEAYAEWVSSDPPEGGGETGAALVGRPSADSPTSGSLVRVGPLAIYSHALPEVRMAELARKDSSLTHPHPFCRDGAAALGVAIRHALGAGDGPEPAYRAALSWARTAGAAPPVVEALEAASAPSWAGHERSTDLVLIAIGNAFNVLLQARSLVEGLVTTVGRGGDVEGNAAIAGALLGAVYGREAVPPQWRSMILSCRAHPLRTARPRPAAYWPTDVLELAERLLLAGRRA